MRVRGHMLDVINVKSENCQKLQNSKSDKQQQQ